jgi:hypothetical protein
MKVALGVRVKQGPWGGGNQFATALERYLKQRGVEVHHDLGAADLDIILLTEPRRSSESSAFNDVDILKYLATVNPRALVVHRVNECDERKNTTLVNRRLALANRSADCTVFVSGWLMDLFVRRGARFVRPRVIQNGGDASLFRPAGAPWDGRGPLRVVTHHWSDNWMKGFDIYGRFDGLLGRADIARMFSYTYIGKLPGGFGFRHTRLLAPLHGPALAEALSQHHVYLTASMNEPAGMHNIEGGLCGLPILYRRSGSLPEFCEGFGIEFDESSFERALLSLPERYGALKARMPQFPHTADRMCAGYLFLFQDLMSHRDEVLAGRHRSSAANQALRAKAALYDRYYSWRMRLESAYHRLS